MNEKKLYRVPPFFKSACALAILLLTLTACAATPTITQVPQNLFRDDLFVSNTNPIKANDIFVADKAMQQFIATEIVSQLRSTSHQRALFNALYSKAQLRLEYDSSYTRTASEAFAARSGNCLSLVIMTAALAKEMGLSVQYQKVITKEDWSRSGGLYFASGHVNVVLGKKRFDEKNHLDQNYQMTIDFLPPQDTASQRTVDLEENTIIAMYMNNRAAESLVRNQTDQAYWWAKEAIIADPQFSYSYNTLGVIYMRQKQYLDAYRALEMALKTDPDSLVATSNMVQTLEMLGRDAEASLLNESLLNKQPFPPFHFFNLGLKAMERNEFQQAKFLFQRELKRAPDYHEFHFWLGLAHFRLGELDAAQQEFDLAKANSTTQKDFALYSAKSDRLNSLRRQ
ncbi:tetratricopeptide repeat protein [Undibacterium sp. Di24W]